MVGIAYGAGVAVVMLGLITGDWVTVWLGLGSLCSAFLLDLEHDHTR